MTPSTWHGIRPWAPSLSLSVREITSVSATFILSSTISDREVDPSLASRGFIAAAEGDPQVEKSDSTSSSSSTNEESKNHSFIANALAEGLSVTVNGSPWPRAFVRIDEQSDEAVIIIYALMPGRQYDIELALISNNDATDLNRQITTEGSLILFFSVICYFNYLFYLDDSDNAPSEIQTDTESPSPDHSTLSDHHSTPSTSPSRTIPGTPTTVPQTTLEEKLHHLQQILTAVNDERETLLASLKTLRKDSQKADSAIRSEIDALKRSSERHALAESRGRQKVLALQEAVKRAQNATKEIEEAVKELQEELPALNKAADEKENEYAILKKEADKVRKEREVLEETEKKRQEATKAELAALAVKLEKLGAKKEKLENGIVPALEQKLKEVEKEIEVEEQNLLKSEREENERKANVQNQYQQYQLQLQRQHRSFHSQSHGEDHLSTSSVPIQKPRPHQSPEPFPTPIGRPTPAPIQRPTQSDFASSNLGYSVAGSTIWTQRPIQQQPQSHPQIPQRPTPIFQHTHPTFSPQLRQLHNPRSLSFHNSMAVPSSTAPTSSNLIRRSSLKNPVSVPSFSTTTTTTTTNRHHHSSISNSGSNTTSSKSVSLSPTRSNASIVASSSTLSSKAPAFEPTRSMSLNSRLATSSSSSSSGMVMIQNPNANISTITNQASSTALPTPIQKPVVRSSSGDK